VGGVGRSLGLFSAVGLECSCCSMRQAYSEVAGPRSSTRSTEAVATVTSGVLACDPACIPCLKIGRRLARSGLHMPGCA
jgi:hypothetical protein